MRVDPSSFRRALAPLLAAACAIAVLAFSQSPVATTQSRIITPQRNSNSSAKRPPVTTLRANDSAEGSRVAVTANQSLNDYEAYRRGDRFYVRIPAADVPRPEAVRGRAFNDVRVQRGASDTVVSFRLQPGASARVEQRGNKLDVVFTMPGSRSSGSTATSRNVVANDAGPAPPAADPQRRGNTNSNRSGSVPTDRSTRNWNERSTSASAKPTPTPRAGASPKPSPTPSAKPAASPSPAAPARTSPVVARSSPSPVANAASPAPATGTTWSQLKQKARYWILLAQLNPVPVGIGVALLLLVIGLFALQRRRARVARRARWRKRSVEPEAAAAVAPAPAAVATQAKPDDVTSETETVVPVTPVTPVAPVVPVVPVAPVAPAAAVAGTAALAGTAAAVAGTVSQSTPAVSDAQHERVTRTSEEVKKLMAGGDYDESIIASDDRYTRQLVGAELSSALVGRNLQRRERARAAFMNHGYFDDATRDLRIGESPNERAAAARRLSFVREREATPHLIAALDDSSPDVRRAAVEALMDLRDPAAIAPLNSLMQTENDRRVPRTLIKHAVEACATSDPDGVASQSQTVRSPAEQRSVSGTVESEREVIEI
jgi:HEAT repeat protein